MKSKLIPEEVFRSFTGIKQPLTVLPIQTGLINYSFQVRLHDNEDSYILQKINSNVFQDVPGMIKNIVAVTEHLQSDRYYTDEFRVMELLKDQNGNYFHKENKNDNIWRLGTFYPDLVSYDSPLDSGMIYEAGKAFGRFTNSLSKLGQNKLIDSIPNFHNLASRIDAFSRVVRDDKNKRRSQCKKEVEYVKDQSDKFIRIEQSLFSTEKCITHNDTKINNVLFDKDRKARCVIDLDTVMPGYLFYDLGDLVRTVATETNEDEADLEKVVVTRERLEAAYDGFFSGANPIQLKREKILLDYAGAFFAFLMGVRFLTDFLAGDKYFSCEYPTHNLVRTKSQFHLCRQLSNLKPSDVYT